MGNAGFLADFFGYRLNRIGIDMGAAEKARVSEFFALQDKADPPDIPFFRKSSNPLKRFFSADSCLFSDCFKRFFRQGKFFLDEY